MNKLIISKTIDGTTKYYIKRKIIEVHYAAYKNNEKYRHYKQVENSYDETSKTIKLIVPEKDISNLLCDDCPFAVFRKTTLFDRGWCSLTGTDGNAMGIIHSDKIKKKCPLRHDL